MIFRFIRDLIATREGNEPETFQMLSDYDPDATWFQQLFSIDIRALAALRIIMGAIAIFFVINQFAYIELLYTDRGILHREHNQQILGSGFWSLFWMNGSLDFARAVMVLTCVAAGVFALGYQTRLMNLILLVLIWSIQVRNPMVLTGGDVLLRMLLFWSLFLPVGATWSFDSLHGDQRQLDWRVASMGTVGIMTQVVYMYFFAGIAKLNAFWLSGDAVEYAMHLEMSVKPIGLWLRTKSDLMYFATLATICAEILTLVVMFIPRLHYFNRGLMCGFFLLLHVGIWLTMSIGLFSITAMAAWLIFIPSDIWNMFFGTPVGFGGHGRDQEGLHWSKNLIKITATVFFVSVTLQNVVCALGPKVSGQMATLELFGRTTMTVQQFQMFAAPPLYSPWFEYNAELESGRRVDLFYPDRIRLDEKPESVYLYMQNQRWRRLHWNLITHPVYPPRTELVFQAVRSKLLQYSVGQWNRINQEDAVKKAELICHLDPVVLDRVEGESVEFKSHQPYELKWATYLAE